MDFSLFLKAFPKIGFIKYGIVCLNHTAPRTNDGTMISSLGEEDAFTTALATVFGLSDVEYFGIDLKDG